MRAQLNPPREITIPSALPSSAGKDVTLTKRFLLPRDLEGQSLGLLVGTLATFGKVTFNGHRLESTRAGLPSFIEPPENTPRLYRLPSEWARFGETNTIRFDLHRTYGGPGGILAGPVQIGNFHHLTVLAHSLVRPYEIFEISALTGVGFGAILVLLLLWRAGWNFSYFSILVLALLITVALLVEGHWLHDSGRKTAPLVRAGWACFSLIPPTTLVFLHRFFRSREKSHLMLQIVIASAVLVAILLLVLPQPENLAIPFTLICIATLGQAATIAFHAFRRHEDEALPVALGLIAFIGFVILGMCEILGVTRMPFPFVPQKGILFFQLGLLSLFASLIWALCSRFISTRSKTRALIQKALTSQDRERSRIGRELHDCLGQSLQAIFLRVKAAEKTSDLAALGPIEGQIRNTIDEVRRISADLHPVALNLLPVGAAIEAFVDEQRGTLPFSVVTDIPCQRQLDRDAQSHLFCIFKEALNNTCRHAMASQVNFSLREQNRHLIFSYRDNGNATPDSLSSPGMGLLTIRERIDCLGGTLDLSFPQNGGLCLHAIVPLDDQPTNKLRDL